MAMFKVVLVGTDHPIPDWVPEKLAAAGVTYVYHECHNRDDLVRHTADADVIWFMCSQRGLVVEENMDVFNKLGAAIKCGSGTDNIDHAACTKRGIIIAHSPDDVTEPTSDHTIAMLLAAVRQVANQDRRVRRGEWSPHHAMPLGGLTGSELGMIGYGRIGKAVVRKLAGFKMRIRIHDPYLDDGEISAVAGAQKVELPELLEQSQYLLVSCPLTPETTNLIGERELRRMRRDAVLVNCARAEIVNEPALLRALKERWIAAAAVDVLAHHPLAPDDEFLTLDNIIFTPHMGGYPASYPDRVFDNPVEDIIRMSRRRRPRWIANPDVVPWWPLETEKT